MRVAAFRVAAIQTVSGNDVAANLAAIEPLIADAADQGAQLVLLPEYFGIFGARATDKVTVRESDGAGLQQDWLARLAREHAIFIICGSVPMTTADPAPLPTACLVSPPEVRPTVRST